MQSVLVDQESKEQSEAEEAKKLRNDVFSYLVKMTDYLYAKAEDESIQEEGSKSMPVNGGGHLPKLIGKAGLNESSSFAVAATIVSFLMQNHGKSVIKVNEVRDKFYECACMFFVVYGQHFTHGTGHESRSEKFMICSRMLPQCSMFRFAISVLGMKSMN